MRFQEAIAPTTPERVVADSDDEDDLFDVVTPEKKAKHILPDVAAIPAAYKVVRLKVADFERNFSTGVNLIVANDGQLGAPQTFVLLSGSWLTTSPEIDSEASSTAGELSLSRGTDRCECSAFRLGRPDGRTSGSIAESLLLSSFAFFFF